MRLNEPYLCLPGGLELSVTHVGPLGVAMGFDFGYAATLAIRVA